MIYVTDKSDFARGLGFPHYRLTKLNLSGTYPAQASTGPLSCTSPREPTMYPFEITINAPNNQSIKLDL